MNHPDDLPRNPAELNEMLTSLVFDDPAEPAVAPPRPRDEDVLVVRTFKLPFDLDTRLRAAAEERGETVSALLRDWVTRQLAELADDQPISRADALRALAGLKPLPATRTA